MNLSGFYELDCMYGMKYIPDNYFDIGIVDPPWGRKEHGGKNRSGFVKQKSGVELFVKCGEYENEEWDNQPVSVEYFNELCRVTRNQIVWGCNYYPIQLGAGRIIWDKVNGKSDQSDCEIAYNSLNNRVDLFRYMWAGMMQGKSIEEGHIMQGNKKLNEKRIHPTQKPIALYRWIIKKYITPGMRILDTHVGSASSLVAFEEAGFNYLGFENNQRMYNKACIRLDEYRKQIKLF